MAARNVSKNSSAKHHVRTLLQRRSVGVSVTIVAVGLAVVSVATVGAVNATSTPSASSQQHVSAIAN